MGTINGISYHSKQIKYNRTAKKRTKKDIKAIVIHYTANYNNGAGGAKHFEYFNGADRNSSADVFIDDHSIWKVNDWTRYYTWAIGDGKGRYGWTNSNTISIEMCVNSDGNFAKTVENTIKYIRYLHSEGYTKELIRHYDASRKLCPIYFVDLTIPGYNKAYQDFRNKVFAKEEKPVAKDIFDYPDSLKWLHDKKFITGTNYNSSKQFNCEQIATILKRVYTDLKPDAQDPQQPVKIYENEFLQWLYDKKFITGTKYMTTKNLSYFNCEQIAVILKRLYADIKG
jgi:N-acetylmuramoyl-L-alanine amidase CwlA